MKVGAHPRQRLRSADPRLGSHRSDADRREARLAVPHATGSCRRRAPSPSCASCRRRRTCPASGSSPPATASSIPSPATSRRPAAPRIAASRSSWCRRIAPKAIGKAKLAERRAEEAQVTWRPRPTPRPRAALVPIVRRALSGRLRRLPARRHAAASRRCARRSAHRHHPRRHLRSAAPPRRRRHGARVRGAPRAPRAALRHQDHAPDVRRRSRRAGALSPRGDRRRRPSPARTSAQVFDVNATRDGQPYLVYELIDGEDLGTLLEREGALPIARATHIARQVASGLLRRARPPASCIAISSPRT